MVDEDIISKYSRDMRISEKIDEKNSKALWDILSNFNEFCCDEKQCIHQEEYLRAVQNRKMI